MDRIIDPQTNVSSTVDRLISFESLINERLDISNPNNNLLLRVSRQRCQQLSLNCHTCAMERALTEAHCSRDTILNSLPMLDVYTKSNPCRSEGAMVGGGWSRGGTRWTEEG